MDAQYELLENMIIWCVQIVVNRKTRPMSPAVKHVGPFEVKDRQTIYYGLCKNKKMDVVVLARSSPQPTLRFFFGSYDLAYFHYHIRKSAIFSPF
jgi:hypothetical protein